MLGTLKLESIWVSDRAASLHAQQSVMCFVVFPMRVVSVICCQQWCANFLGQFNEQWIGLMLFSNSVILNLDEEIVFAKNVLQSTGISFCPRYVAFQHLLQHMTTQTSTRCNDAFAVSLEKLPVHSRLVVVALKECKARQLDEVLVTNVVLGKQGEVVIHLSPTFGFASRVVNATATRRTFRAMLMSHVCLGANDWLNPFFFALLIKIDDAIHVAVIGHSKRWHSFGCSFANQFIKPRCAVQHRIFGMDMQVSKRICHYILSAQLPVKAHRFRHR